MTDQQAAVLIGIMQDIRTELRGLGFAVGVIAFNLSLLVWRLW